MSDKKPIFLLVFLIVIIIFSIIFVSKKIESKSKVLPQQPVMTDESMPGMKH